MTRNQRRIAAAFLLCLSAVAVQRARAQEAVAPWTYSGVPGVSVLAAPEAQGVASGPVSGSASGPVSRTASGTGSPAAPISFDRLMHEAELAYRAQDHDRAYGVLMRLVEIDRLRIRPWLRLGNLHQQAGRIDEAVAAYRQATLGVPHGRIDEEARNKAHANLALLGMDQARSAIDALEKRGSTQVRSARAQAANELQSERKRYERVQPRNRGASRPGSKKKETQETPAESSAAEAESELPVVTPVMVGTVAVRAVPVGAITAVTETTEPPEPPAHLGPYTVDRWIAIPRKHTRAPARPGLNEPLVADPLPSRPKIEYIQPGWSDDRKASQ